VADHKKTVAATQAKVTAAKAKAFIARMEAIDAILEGTNPHDAMMIAAYIAAGVSPLCCSQHQDEFKADLLRMLNDAIDVEEDLAERDDVEAEAAYEDGDAPPQVH
jgi:hypothetical protein